MIDMHKQIYEALSLDCENVAAGYPEESVLLPAIRYSEITNTVSGKWQQRTDYQIDIYAGTFEEMLLLSLSVDLRMSSLGFDRTYTSPDTAAREGKDLYHRAMNYRALIDTHNEQIIAGGGYYG